MRAYLYFAFAAFLLILATLAVACAVYACLAAHYYAPTFELATLAGLLASFVYAYSVCTYTPRVLMRGSAILLAYAAKRARRAKADAIVRDHVARFPNYYAAQRDIASHMLMRIIMRNPLRNTQR